MCPKKLFFQIFLVFLCEDSLYSQAIFNNKFLDKRVNSVSIINDTTFYLTESGLFFLQKDTTMELLLKGNFYSLQEYQKQKLLLSSNTIFLLDSKYNLTKLLNLENQITNSRISTICPAKANNIYLGCRNGIAYKVKLHANWSIDTIRANLPADLYELFYDYKSNMLWAATDSGVYFSSDSIFKFLKLKSIDEPIFSISKSGEYLYFGGAGKILQYSTFYKTEPVRYYTCDNNIVKKILIVDNSVWFLSDNIIGSIQNNYFYKFAEIKYGNIVSSMATCISLDEKRNLVYVGTEGKGVFLFKDVNLSYRSQCFSSDTCISGRKKSENGEITFNAGIGRKFNIKWKFDRIPDQILIYEGKKIIFNSKKFPNPQKSREWNYSKDMTTIQPTIKIVVLSNKKKGTIWDYCIDFIN